MGRKLAKLRDKERGPFKLEARGGEHHQSRTDYRVIRWREGEGGDEDDPPPYTGTWFATPPALCPDAQCDLAMSEHAVLRSPASDPMGSEPQPGPTPHAQPATVNLGQTYPIAIPNVTANAAELSVIAKTVREAGTVALDIETYGSRRGDALDPWKGDIRLLSLRVLGNDPWLLDRRAIGYDLGELKHALEAVEIVAHNAKFDLLWLHQKCDLRVTRVFCTLTAARLLSAGSQPGNNLDQCLDRYCGIGRAEDHSGSDWGAMLLTDPQLAYAARDVAHLDELTAALRENLDAAELSGVARIEMQLLPIIVDMEAAGVAVDVAKLCALRDSALAEAHSAAARLRDLLGDAKLNPASTRHLLPALKARGIAVESTDEESLKAADDGQIIPVLLACRASEKQVQQAATLIKAVRHDGRIHGRFDPTGTATGRFSSKEPNLQNIGRGELRSCFVAAPDHKLIVADYSQIELRAAACIAGEKKMIDAYKRGEDLHRQTAASVLGKPLDEVTKEDRQLSKAVNFGLLYGQSAQGLVRYAASGYGVKLELEKAESIRKAFFRTYGALRQWHGESRNKVEAGVGEVRTLTGRRRIMPPEASPWNRFAALVNTPVQGGCADGLKHAMVRLHRELPPQARLLSTVHDEIIVEAPNALAESVCVQVSAVMREAMSALFTALPIEVEAHICEHWGQK